MMPKRTPEPDYAKFLKSLDLKLISLVESDFRIDRARYFAEKNTELSVEWDSKLARSKPGFFECEASLDVSLKSPKSKLPSFALRATFLLHVHAKGHVKPEFLNDFSNSEVRLVVWPYFREYLSSICGRMHVPPLFIPL